MRNVLKGFAVVSCVGLLAALLAGCGGDDNGNDDSAAAPVFGDLGGVVVALGLPGNSMCAPAGGSAAAQVVIAEERVVGLIGTSCSGAGAAASRLLSAAGLVMISPSNTSLSLTSDLEGNRNANYYPGYCRLSNNDIYTGRAADTFGDCGNGSTNVYRHTDTAVSDPAALEVVYRFAPCARLTGRACGV